VRTSARRAARLYISSRDAVDNPRAPPAESGRRNYRPPAISHAARRGPTAARGRSVFRGNSARAGRRGEQESRDSRSRLRSNPIAARLPTLVMRKVFVVPAAILIARDPAAVRSPSTALARGVDSSSPTFRARNRGNRMRGSENRRLPAGI
jgi:hypothetical protein